MNGKGYISNRWRRREGGEGERERIARGRKGNTEGCGVEGEGGCISVRGSKGKLDQVIARDTIYRANDLKIRDRSCTIICVDREGG